MIEKLSQHPIFIGLGIVAIAATLIALGIALKPASPADVASVDQPETVVGEGDSAAAPPAGAETQSETLPSDENDVPPTETNATVPPGVRLRDLEPVEESYTDG